MNDEDTHWIIRHFSWGDVITLVVLLATTVAGYTSLNKDVTSLKTAVARIEGRDITPGAAQRLSVLEERVRQREEAERRCQIEIRDQRAEILQELRELNEKFDRHLEGNKHERTVR